MDSDQGKLFIGGISWETNEEMLLEYFQGFGEVQQTVVMRDKISGKPRGFGFVVFSDPNVLDRVLQEKHVIDGRTVDAKRALSREEQQVSKVGNFGGARNFGASGGMRTKKIFVGGLPPTLSEDGFRQYFESYGVVTDVVIMYDQQTNRPRGFGFISFDSEDAVDRVLHKTFHDVNGKQVEVKRAMPKDANPGGGGRSMTGGSVGGMGGFQSSYDGRMESNRYTQSQNAGGYPGYGSSGYNAPDYGYGPRNNGTMGYGYGGYGGVNAGYGGLAGGGYGNPNAAYGGPPNAQRNQWGSQAAAAAAAAAYGYGNSQWGTPSGGGNAGGSGGGGAVPSQSQLGSSDYGNQGYAYGGYGGNDGTYGGYPQGGSGGYGDGSNSGRGGF